MKYSWSPVYSFVTIYVTEIKEMSGRKSDLCKLKMLSKNFEIMKVHLMFELEIDRATN